MSLEKLKFSKVPLEELVTLGLYSLLSMIRDWWNGCSPEINQTGRTQFYPLIHRPFDWSMLKHGSWKYSACHNDNFLGNIDCHRYGAGRDGILDK